MVGFVWQQTARNVVPYLTGTENVAFPLALAGVRRKERDRRAAELLDVLGVGYCADRRPGQMSGGEQQRVAIAVALANSPQVLFADEPTGELDSATSARRARGPADRQPRAGHDGRRRHARPGRQRARAAHRRHPRRAHQLRGRPRARTPARTAPSTWSPRSWPCSTGPAACSCRASTARPSTWSAACGWRWRSRTSRCGREAGPTPDPPQGSRRPGRHSAPPTQETPIVTPGQEAGR